MVRKLFLACAVLTGAAAVPAGAVPIAFTVAPATGATNVGTLTVTGTGFTGSGTTDVSGTVVADVDFTGGVPETVQLLTSSDVGFSDVQVGPGGILGGTSGARATVSSPVLPVTGGDSVDVGGATLTADQGTLTLGGTTRDLATDPLAFAIDNTSLLTLSATASAGVETFTLTGPISGSVTENGVTYQATLADFSASGTAPTPEPASLAVLGVGSLLLQKRRRRAAV